ncbi:MAG: glycosyltransferase family 39 protein [Caldilineaceae bacterium]|nr:glycosyltransferase family 39 protein [Caldilineaceae bacterium]
MSEFPAISTQNSLSRRQKWLITLGLALLLWLPRGLALDHFVAVDERSWLTRSGNFYLALATGDLASTYQSYHPGVTTMWLGMLGYLWQYPGYPADAIASGTGQITSMSEGIEDTLVAHGHLPMTLLAAGRMFMVLAIVALLLVAFWLAMDLLGWLPALTGLILLGFEPMGLGLTRMLHVDGLSSALMLVSVLAFMRFYAPTPAIAGRWRDLILSGGMAGLAWLTKSPALVLGPMALLIVGIDLLRRWHTQRRLPAATLGRTVRVFALWGGMAALIFVLCWPSMWVRPIANIQAIFSAAEEYAEESNQKIFFNGEIILDDPGALFYPLTYVWHVTPITLIGLGLALIAGVVGLRRRSPLWQSTAILLLYALIFTTLMTFGSKKIERYLLPAYFPLALIAAVGWNALTRALGGMSANGLWSRWLLPLALATHAALILPHFPYYFTFYNPLLGGNARAPEVLMIGLGEGLDEAARYLNAKPNAEQLRVASWYRGGSFNFIFRGQDLNLDRFFEADYAVIYIHQWQRQAPDARMMAYFAQLTPEYTVKLHGLDYASVYDLRDAPTPDYFTDWAGAIRLTDTELPRASLLPGDEFLVNLHLYTIGTMDSNLNAIVRLTDAGGNEVARSEGWPFGSATSTWQPGDAYIDGHELTLPSDVGAGYLRLELGFYDGNAQKLVTPMVAGTTTPRGDFVGVGYVAVGLAGKQPALLQTPPLLGDQIKLVGSRLQGLDLGDHGKIPRVEAMPGLPLLLAWQPTRPANTDYVTLVHLIAPDGTLAQQYDRAPLQGVVPTTLWREGDILLDAYHLDIPPNLPPGDYALWVGLYDLPTLTRLPVQIDHAPAGDTIQVATVIVP